MSPCRYEILLKFSRLIFEVWNPYHTAAEGIRAMAYMDCLDSLLASDFLRLPSFSNESRKRKRREAIHTAKDVLRRSPGNEV